MLDADELARTAVAPGSDGLRAVVEEFGDEVLTEDGELDRAFMRAVVFSDADARARLEAIVHPRVERMRREWLAERSGDGEAIAVVQIPLLFEVGLDDRFDLIVFVDASVETRLRRMVEHRGIDESEARRIIESQMDPEEKRARSDFIISNDSTLDALREAGLQVLEEIRAREEGGD